MASKIPYRVGGYVFIPDLVYLCIYKIVSIRRNKNKYLLVMKVIANNVESRDNVLTGWMTKGQLARNYKRAGKDLKTIRLLYGKMD